MEDFVMFGPGEYLPDPTEGITDPKDLPKPKIVERSRNFSHRPCPRCGKRREPTTARQAGAVGGNVGALDGSVTWKRILQMYEKYWTYTGDGGHRGAW